MLKVLVTGVSWCNMFMEVKVPTAEGCWFWPWTAGLSSEPETVGGRGLCAMSVWAKRLSVCREPQQIKNTTQHNSVPRRLIGMLVSGASWVSTQRRAPPPPTPGAHYRDTHNKYDAIQHHNLVTLARGPSWNVPGRGSHDHLSGRDQLLWLWSIGPQLHK